MLRTTLKHPVTLQGTGLFSAQHAQITIAPNTNATGIHFTINEQTIPAHIDALCSRPVHPVFAQLKPRSTTVGSDAHSIATIEHILSALAGLQITDAIIHVRSDHAHAEIPILDGSSKPFVEQILAAGLQSLDTQQRPIIIDEPITVEDAGATIRIEPSDTLSFSYQLEYPDTPIGSAQAIWSGDRDEYIDTIAPARTFSLEHEAKQMQAAGLFTHLTPRDMLVIGKDGPIDNAYRLPDECARHKLLDLIGDLALVGAPLIAEIHATRSGHALAHEAARAIVEQQKSRAQ